MPVGKAPKRIAPAATSSSQRAGAAPEELLELELEDDDELLELLDEPVAPLDDDELETSPEELEDELPGITVPLDELLVLEVDELPLDELDELEATPAPEELEELELDPGASPVIPDEEEEEPGGVGPGGTGLGPPLLHPCNARALTVNSNSARFFKVSLLNVLYL